jgi:hypothetical protein
LAIYRTPQTDFDIGRLAELRQLKQLVFVNWDPTTEEGETLQKALPTLQKALSDCRIRTTRVLGTGNDPMYIFDP